MGEIDAADVPGTIAAGFPERLRQLREDSGLSRAKLSKICGVHTRTIESYEQGLSHPSWESVLRFAHALGVPVGAFAVIPRRIENP